MRRCAAAARHAVTNPHQVNKATLLEKIAELVRARRSRASRPRDESDRSGMRIVIGLKRDARRRCAEPLYA